MKTQSNSAAGSGCPATTCSLSSIPKGAELSNIEAENSQAADAILAASKLLVDVGHDVIPSEGLEEGRPSLRADESVRRSRTPDWNDNPRQTRVTGTCLERVDNVVLVGGGLGTEGRIERDDNHIDPLLVEVGNLESIHGESASGNSVANSQVRPPAP